MMSFRMRSSGALEGAFTTRRYTNPRLPYFT